MNNKPSEFERSSRFLPWLTALLLTALVAGCGGGGGGQDPILGAGDIGNIAGAPTVTFVAPLPKATGVPVNTKIVTAAFSEAMDPATLTAASFTLACAAGTSVTGAVSYLATGNEATFTLSAGSNLPPSTVCTATITTAARDATDVPLASNFVWTFTTGLATDTTPPTVSGTVNLNGATGVAVNTKIVFTYSEPIDPLTINATTFTVKQGATPVAGTVTHAGLTSIFTPASNLAANTAYTVTATTGVKDTAGNPMASDFAVTWSTGADPDTTAPTVTGAIHTNGQTNVAVNTNVGVTFSEAMDPLTVTTVNLTVKQTATGTPVVGVVAYSGVSAVFNPVSDLAANTNYTVTVKGGASGAKDLAGNPMVSDFVITWTTGAAPDTTAPTVTGTIQTNGQINVAINTSVGATFSEGMDPLTVTTVSFRVQTVTGVPVAGVLNYSGVSAVFDPVNDLAPNTRYSLTVKGGASGVKDLAGNPMVGDFVINWSTAAAVGDTTAPTVTGAIHTNGQTDVAFNTNVGATFSESMDPLTVTNVNFTVKQTASGTPVVGVVTYSGVSAVFNPVSVLAANTSYTVTVKGGASGVKDLAGNPMVSDFVITWTTGAAPDTTAPTVTGAIHTNGQTNVDINTNAGVTFSEAMDPLTVTTVNFTLKQTASGTPVVGVVTYSGVSAVFIPLVDLTPSTNYTVAVKSGASGVKDLAGNPMVSDFIINWTTGAAPDTTAPTVTGAIHTNGQTNVDINTNVGVTFSEAMDPLTVTTVNFTLKQTASGTPVVGIVTYSGVSAVFDPVSDLAPNTGYTVTVKGGASGVMDLAGNPMVSDFVIGWTTGAASDTTAPTVTGTINADGATNISVNTNAGATFSEGMDPLTVTTATFTLKQGVTAVPGTVSYTGVNAVFTPVSTLAANTTYTATITTGAKDLAGNALASDFVWSWSTAAALDTTPPTVISTSPADLATAVAVNSTVNATFSEAMELLSISNVSFTLACPVGTPITGTVNYVLSTSVATFTPASDLPASVTCTATITGAKDLAGNALAAGLVPNPWTFTTAAALPGPGPAPVILGSTLEKYAIIAGSTVTNTGPTLITGAGGTTADLGVSPGAAVTGFPPGNVNGTIRAATPDAATAKLELTTAYNDAQGRTLAPITVAGNIGGQTLAPGLYKSTSTLAISSGDLTLAGPANGVWIFQMASTLTTTAGLQVILSGGAQAKNVFWAVGTSATLGTNSVMVGNILADQSITLTTGAVLNGRALTRIAAVSLDSNPVTKPLP